MVIKWPVLDVLFPRSVILPLKGFILDMPVLLERIFTCHWRCPAIRDYPYPITNFLHLSINEVLHRLNTYASFFLIMRIATKALACYINKPA
jgi:hypothetical protein